MSNRRSAATELPAAGAGHGWALERGSRQHEFLQDAAQRKLTRSRDDRFITGLCGGIAEFTGFRAGVVRALFVATTVVSLGVVGAGYLVLSMLIPASPAD